MEEGRYWTPQPLTTLFIGGLSQDTTERDIVKYVEQFCPVLGINMPTHKTNRKHASYAFVDIASSVAARNIIKSVNIIKDRQVDCQEAVEKKNKELYKEDLVSRKVFIAGIKSYVNFKNVVRELEVFGDLKKCYRIKSSHINRGLAFAEFFNSESAANLVATRFEVDGCRLRISYFRPKVTEPEIIVQNPYQTIHHQTKNPDYENANSSCQGFKPSEDNRVISHRADKKEILPKTANDLQNISPCNDGNENFLFRIVRREASTSKVIRATIAGSVVFRRQPMGGNGSTGISHTANLLHAPNKTNRLAEVGSKIPQESHKLSTQTGKNQRQAANLPNNAPNRLEGSHNENFYQSTSTNRRF